MRSSRDFIEVHGARTRNLQLINKRAIVFVIPSEGSPDEQNAVIIMARGEHSYKIVCEESYKEVTEELLWDPNCEDTNEEGEEE